MFTVEPLTIVTASQGLQTQDWTWGSLCFKAFGPKNPILADAKKSLEETGGYDMGGGVYLTTKGDMAKYHKP